MGTKAIIALAFTLVYPRESMTTEKQTSGTDCLGWQLAYNIATYRILGSTAWMARGRVAVTDTVHIVMKV